MIVIRPTKPLLLSMILSQGLTAAPITWTVHNITGNVSDVSTKGTLVDSRAGADAGITVDVVDGGTFLVNGVTFDDDHVIENPSHVDTLNQRCSVASSGPNVDYYTLLRHADRLREGDATIAFTGLTIGHLYQVQIWHSDNTAEAGLHGVVLNHGGTVSKPTHGAPGHATLLAEVEENVAGQYAIGTFVADSTSQSILARAWTQLTGQPKESMNTAINALQLRDLGAGAELATSGSGGPDQCAPSPNPPPWATKPKANGSTSITMTAATVSDPSGVQYYFTETSGNAGGSNSVWQDSPTYTDTGLKPGKTYSYTVKARDKSTAQNETVESVEANASTAP